MACASAERLLPGPRSARGPVRAVRARCGGRRGKEVDVDVELEEDGSLVPRAR